MKEASRVKLLQRSEKVSHGERLNFPSRATSKIQNDGIIILSVAGFHIYFL
jgi:hypothetical protein